MNETGAGVRKKAADVENLAESGQIFVHGLGTINIHCSFYDSEYNLLPEVRVKIINENTIEFQLGVYYIGTFSKLFWKPSSYKGIVRVVVIG